MGFLRAWYRGTMKFMYDFQRATKIVGIKKRKKNQTKVNKFIKTSNNKKKKKNGDERI